ncbi:PorP/SprF family type IX secretion system membrane protein [Robiginitalea sp. IMCC43444]|uniref:PorP/SprF family type IX secretion system membrane protein n=1 Tax=Robiginitalea sp. IMCC43444 TaxID=3459121 RepID=UPI0040416E3E
MRALTNCSGKLRNVLFGVLSLTALFATAQREPVYTQYMYNIGSFNPAYVGSVEHTDLSLLYRSQWIDFPGAPRTIRFGANIPLGNQKHGIGFNAINDQLGPSSQTFIDVSYSFQVRLGEESFISFGVDAGGSILDVDFSKGSFENPGEPILDQQSVNEFYPTVGAGIFIYGSDWYLGASTPNLLTDGLYNNEVATITADVLQYNFIAGVVFNISDGLKFKPAVLLNYLEGNPLTFNGSANFLISDLVTVGASYRVNESVSGLAGFQISNSLFLGYSYDYNTNGLGAFNNGSHEAILKFYFGREKRTKNTKIKGKKEPKQIDSPRFF